MIFWRKSREYGFISIQIENLILKSYLTGMRNAIHSNKSYCSPLRERKAAELINLEVLKRKWSEIMAIEIKDLNLVPDIKDLQGESLNSSTTSEIRGGYNPYNDPYIQPKLANETQYPSYIIAAVMSYH
jgi:hypothetical protein